MTITGVTSDGGYSVSSWGYGKEVWAEMGQLNNKKKILQNYLLSMKL